MKGRTIKLVDLFAGAGGTSCGAIRAAERRGYRVELTAVNHWERAVETHALNHPQARHLCTGVDDINPRSLFKAGELWGLWASPECTNHSQAKGGKPLNEQSRATAHCVTRWAEALQPSVILVENVPEFLKWGPLDSKGRPVKAREGELFGAWQRMLEATGYRVDWRILCAADYGDPTTRERLFIQAVRGRRRIAWPEPTHCEHPDETDLMFGIRKPWRPAREIIDWSVEGVDIFEREKLGMPALSENTMKRIWAGLESVGLRKVEDGRGQPFLVPNFGERKGQAARFRSVDVPLPCVTSRGAGNLIEPFLIELRGTSERQLAGSARSLDSPLGTVTAGGQHHYLVEPSLEPFLVQATHGDGGDPKGPARRVRTLDKAMPTITGSREWYLCEPSLLPQVGGGALRSVDQPAPTVACDGAIALVEPMLIEYFGTGKARSVSRPFGAMTTKPRYGLLRPMVDVEGKRLGLVLNYRMLKDYECAGAQGFPREYRFAGNQTERFKQIGNAVPPGFSDALIGAQLDQQ